MVLAMGVLFGWQYFFAPKPPPVDNTNASAPLAPATPAAAPTATPQTSEVATSPATEAPRREITIRSSLYEVKIDSKGALATSWIILRNMSGDAESPIYGDGSTASNQKPLQLISPKALEQSPREVPFRLMTGDAATEFIVNDSSYAVEGADSDLIELAGNETLTVEFVHRQDVMLAGSTQPVEIRKKFTFTADSYVSDLAIAFTRNGAPVPNVKLAIGASIGDHAINHHTLYHTESEAVVAKDDDISRYWGYYSFEYDAAGKSQLADRGTIDWVAMSDAYFAMAAIPATPVQSADYRSTRYDVDIEPVYDSIVNWVIRSPKKTETRHLLTAYMPVATDSAVTKIFTGPKDYDLLKGLSDEMKAADGRTVSIVDLINFSNYWWLRWLTKPLSIPILHALSFFNSILGNYGAAIIVFTFLFYSLLFPLRWKQSKSFKKAAGNAPKMKEIQDRLKELQKKGVPNDDPRMRAIQMEQLKMTKDALPIGGCLPMLLQFPLLIAFYTAITIAVDVRQAHFLWLPDLSAGDPWHILEFAFAFSMILSMKFTPQGATITPEQQMQQKMMTYLMPAMMLWVMWAAPSGLLLYWFFGNIVSFGQQMVINHFNKTNTPPGTEVVDTVPKNAKRVKAKPKLRTA